MPNDCRLTTIDNPYNPFEQFTSWYSFDVEHHYNTCSLIARLSNVSDDMSQDEIDIEVERVIDEIIKQDFLNIYKKITRN
jgi:hypothetical protein